MLARLVLNSRPQVIRPPQPPKVLGLVMSHCARPRIATFTFASMSVCVCVCVCVYMPLTDTSIFNICLMEHFLLLLKIDLVKIDKRCSETKIRTFFYPNKITFIITYILLLVIYMHIYIHIVVLFMHMAFLLLKT